MSTSEARYRFLPYVFAAACTAVYLSLVFNENIWVDEAFSASIIRCGFGEMISETFADTLPPFYNVSAWIFTHIFGFSTITLKIFSVIPMLLLMLLSAYYIPKTVSVRASCLYMVMMTAMPHFLEHGTEIRMYSWAVFFSSATAILAVCYLRSVKRSGIWLVLCTVLGAYTHQYALIAEAFVWLMLLAASLRDKTLKQWCRKAAVCIICYIPCAVLTVFQMKEAVSYFSASPATIDSFLSSVRYPFVTNVTAVSAVLMIFTVLLFIYSCTKKLYVYAWYILIFFLVTVVSFAIMYATGSTFFSSRYLMPSIGILWLGAAAALDRLLSENKYVWYAAIPLAAAVFLIVYTQRFKSEYTDMSAFRSFIESTDEDDGYVVFEDFPEIEICLGYYAPWLECCDLDGIEGVKGRKYVFVNRDMHTDDVEKIKEKKYDLKYIENLSFDRYTFRAYELIEQD